ncbi:6093_t:CDS:1 [Funneliformis mosseae]|uniref:6093_t:CDS:1 n=1 Tax=Funneliformis mosseae TaxID=27381 RepID=A0A9N8VXB5_FUNMO|nr:6093_t:CDS:1 [Funneliformis mosseae]
MTRKRAIASIINDEKQVNHSSDIYTHKRSKLCYYCSKCNGNLVDLHTKELHDLKDQKSGSNSSNESTMINMIQENKVEFETAIIYESLISDSLHQFGQIQRNV